MIIGVISDTHGNRALMHQVADHIRGVEKADFLIHLGDNYPDAEELAFAGHAIRMVPGLQCDAYRDHRVPNLIVETYDGLTVACTHAEHDFHGRVGHAHILMSGHTHVARIEPSGKQIHLNPGHLKSPLDRGQLPSYATIVTAPGAFEIFIKAVDGTLRLSRRFERAPLGVPAGELAP